MNSSMKKKHKLTISNSANSILQVYFEIAHLKDLFRQGWLQAGIPIEKCESVADHSFLTTMLAWMIAEELAPELDSEKIIKMSLLHEMGEIYGGDITPRDGVGESEKFLLEYDSMHKVLSKLFNGEKWSALWEEFEKANSPEAKFVKQIDKLEMALQAYSYEQSHKLDLMSFYKSTENVLEDENLKEILAEILSEKKNNV